MINEKKAAVVIGVSDGTLGPKASELFTQADLAITVSPRRYTGTVSSPMIEEVIFMRPQDMPWVVEQGTLDVGICGADCVSESGSDVVEVATLSYSRTTNGPTRVVLIAPADDPCMSGKDIPDSSVIHSEYPNLTARWLEYLGKRNIIIQFSYGRTEAKVSLMGSYGVCLTETGASLAANNLKIVDVLMESDTVLIANKAAMNNPRKADTIRSLGRILFGAREAWDYVMLVMNVPMASKEAIVECLPALKRPTIAPLYGGEYVSISTVVLKAHVNDVVSKIHGLGAEGVVVMPIVRMIPNDSEFSLAQKERR